MTEGFNKVFIDTAPLVYIVENINDFADPAENKIIQLSTNSIFITSVITYTEFCIIPERTNNQQLIKEFGELLTILNCDIKNIDITIAKATSKLRAKYQSLRTPDALQLATAIHHNCNKFLTNDKKLKQVSEIEVVLITD
ncbi:MAG: PIN domain-containing protein [Bacteroidota bacterium]|nr:PIN domain-containing protein [Bacteroidota bacterium]